jgi:hypothetical protein
MKYVVDPYRDSEDEIPIYTHDTYKKAISNLVLRNVFENNRNFPIKFKAIYLQSWGLLTGQRRTKDYIHCNKYVCGWDLQREGIHSILGLVCGYKEWKDIQLCV